MTLREIGQEYYPCSKCSKTKLSCEFGIVHRRNRIEVRSVCKSCASIYDKNRDKEKVHAKNIRYYREHKKEIDAKSVLWQANNKERRNEIARNVYARHIDRMREERREYYRNNKDKWRTYFHSRRAREKYANGNFSETEWIALLEKYDYTCLSCGKQNTFLTADHIVPLSKGGSNSINNIQPLCKSCNSSKFTKTIDYRVNYDSQ